MRALIAISMIALSACAAPAADSEPTGAAPGLDTAGNGNHGQGNQCSQAPDEIVDAFATFDARTSPPALNQPAAVVLAPWLARMTTDVVFESGNDAPRVGRAAVAGYFEPLLPVIGSVVHDIDSVSPVCGQQRAWTIRGTLLITRRSDGHAISPIPFTDTLFFDNHGKIARYEIRFDPTPIGQLFAP